MLKTVLLICVLLASLEIGCAKKNNDGGEAYLKGTDSAAADTAGIIRASLENKESDTASSGGQLRKINSAAIIDTVTVTVRDTSLKTNDGGVAYFKKFGLAIADSINSIEEIKISFTYPTAIPNTPNAALAELQKNFITQASLGKECEGLEPSAAVKCAGKDFIDEIPDDWIGDESKCQYLYSIHDALLFPIPGFVEYETFYESYTCGAHGYGAFQYSLYNLADGKKVEPKDIFTAGWEQDVTKIIIKKYLQDKGEKSLKDDGYAEEKDFIPNGGMLSIEADSITFAYVSYKIAPYAAGPQYISVSWDELKPYLNKQSALYPKLKFKYTSHN
jgi:hypothetical protein